MGWLIGFFGLTSALMACSCREPVPACERFPGSKVVFIGTVLEGNDDGSGRFTQGTAYLVRVDEVLRGLAPEQKEVFIDPGSYTSCYTGYTVGATYLFYAGGMGTVIATTLMGSAGQPKKVPASWEAKKDLKVYSSAQCSGSKLLEHAAEDVAWIRRAMRGETTTRVYGAAYQHYSSFGDRDGNVPLAEAKVFLRGQEPYQEATTGPDGEYSFDGVAPGRYYLWAERAPWIGSYRDTIDVRAGGCVERALRLESHGSLQGKVRQADGTPATNTRVELVRVLPDGTLARTYSLGSDTNEQGNFALRDVPAGEFVVGVNIRSAMTPEAPWKPTFYPGVPTQREARVFRLRPNETVTDLAIKLPPPMPIRTLLVRVFWADGTPALNGARAYAEPVEHAYQFNMATVAKEGNIVRMQIMRHYSYRVNADWFNWIGGRSKHVRSEPVNLPAGKDAAVVDIRLSGNQPRTGK